MTHPVTVVELALALRREGLSATEIGRRIGVPRPTVRDWISGREPRQPRVADACTGCGWAAHDFGALPVDYVYLLGLYLGDGCLSTHPGASTSSASLSTQSTRPS
jgi:Homeodomain-like domain